MLRLLLVAIAVSGLSACKKPTVPSTVTKVSARETFAIPPTPPPTTPEISERPARNRAPAPVDAAPADAADLERKFFATTESEERGAVAEELWSLNTAAALTALHRLLNVDPKVDVKMDIISGLVDAEATPETREIRWALLLAALAQTQPQPVRELAASVLADAEDPRAFTLLQSFANDPDEEVRETIRAGLEERREERSP